MGKVELLAVEGTAGNPLCSLWQGWHQGAGEIAVEFKEITCLKKKKKKSILTLSLSRNLWTHVVCSCCAAKPHK